MGKGNERRRPLQDDIFRTSEGNQWFTRNREALSGFSIERDPVFRLLNLYQIAPRSIVEIGASNGARVAALAERFGAHAVAVEPSAEAIRDGRRRFPGVDFVHATASDVPHGESADLVIVSFVLHWVDRATLLRSAAEIDRLTQADGYLVISDFFPDQPVRRRYHHLEDEEVWTYKQNYAELFVASGLYTLIGMLSAHHAGGEMDPVAEEQDRIATWLLRKAGSWRTD